MATGAVFRTNRTQAVRLPKAVAFADNVQRVSVRIEGDSRVLTPVSGSFQQWAASRLAQDPDFLADRDQGIAQERNWE
ncbi:MAG: antitoxin [Propionibacteriaceae bacterium]|nr:antitoxin [Propionibacteriaceae bacterium]